MRIIVPSVLACLGVAGYAAETSPPEPIIPDPVVNDDPIVITAHRRPTPLGQATAQVDVIDREAMRQRGYPDLAHETLVDLPGVHVRTSGGSLSTTTVFLRGAESYHTRIMLDGVPLESGTTPRGDLTFDAIVPVGVEQVEVLRGSQGGVYGSRAIGGVVSYITRNPTPEHSGMARAEVGNHETFAGSVEGGGPISDDVGYAFAVSGGFSDGYSFATQEGDNGDPGDYEDDGYRRLGALGRVRANVGDHASLGASVYLWDVAYETDDGFATTPWNDDVQETESQTVRVMLDGEASIGEQTDIAGEVAYTRVDRDQTYAYLGNEPTDNYLNDAWWLSGRVFHQIDDLNLFSAGVDLQRDDVDITADSDGFSSDLAETSRQVGLWAGLRHAPDEWVLDGTIRYDDHDQAGEAWTARLAGIYNLPEHGVAVRAVLASGFRAPSVFELYDGSSGNEDLDPEESVSYETSVTWSPVPEFTATVTWFRLDFETLISYNSSTFAYENITGAEVDGLELAFEVAPESIPVVLRAFYSRTDGEDEDGDPLAYRPRDRVGVSAVHTWDSSWVRVAWRYQGDSTTGSADIDAFSLVDLAAGWTPDERWEITARVENLFDADYELTPKTSTPGITGTLGVGLRY